ncbi:serine/arginine repetitive matrix protein 1-like [Eriocheir sinensis]|uniref:serine/arginine repetitive matrix protein 1-like n=1 Tax=Eriocheir sinensis TaxID=95602 RepID=UPI0021C61CF6|nr:serine/arginine repetitive matrix protein 1-like [Eriocheir sinensis]
MLSRDPDGGAVEAESPGAGPAAGVLAPAPPLPADSRCCPAERTPRQHPQEVQGSAVQRLRQASSRRQHVLLLSSLLARQGEAVPRGALQVTGRRVAARDAHAYAPPEDSESPARRYLVRVEQLLAARRRGREAARGAHAISGARPPAASLRTPVAAQRDRACGVTGDANTPPPGSRPTHRFPRPRPAPRRREPRAPALCGLLLVRSSVLCQPQAPPHSARRRHRPPQRRAPQQPQRRGPTSRSPSPAPSEDPPPLDSPRPQDPRTLFTVTVRPATAAQQHHHHYLQQQRQERQQREAPPPLRQTVGERGGGGHPAPAPPSARALTLAPASPRLCAHVSKGGGSGGGTFLPAPPRRTSLQSLASHSLRRRPHPDLQRAARYISPRALQPGQSDALPDRVHTPPPPHTSLVPLGPEQRPPG